MDPQVAEALCKWCENIQLRLTIHDWWLILLSVFVLASMWFKRTAKGDGAKEE